MILGILKEPDFENRVSITPDVVDAFVKLGIEVWLEEGAGTNASFVDSEYLQSGAKTSKRSDLFAKSDLLIGIHCLPTADFSLLRAGQIFIATVQPLANPKLMKDISATGVTLFSMDAIPRITRAQSMDVLSSQATVSGYKSVLLAANSYGRFFPMLTTAAGTITPARVLILGAGVAGLQAIATSRRLGAVVDVFDTRPEVKEQCLSLGAKFVEVEGAVVGSNTGGYAVEQTEEYKNKQKEAIAKYIEKADIAISTALIPGKKAPILITKEMVESMRKGSVIVDLAAVMGGNCELTQNEKTIHHKGVTILGYSNLPSLQPIDASKMYAKNILNFLKLFFQKDKSFSINNEDEIIANCLVTEKGEVCHKGTLALLTN